jgi:hypothetical protein
MCTRCKTDCEAHFAWLSPWFATVHLCHHLSHCLRLRGIHFELVLRTLCILAPRATPNELLLTAVALILKNVLLRGP